MNENCVICVSVLIVLLYKMVSDIVVGHFLWDTLTLTIISYWKLLKNCCAVGVKAKTLINESRQSTATMIGATPEGTDVSRLLRFSLYFQICIFLQINVSY